MSLVIGALCSWFVAAQLHDGSLLYRELSGARKAGPCVAREQVRPLHVMRDCLMSMRVWLTLLDWLGRMEGGGQMFRPLQGGLTVRPPSWHG